MSLAIVFWIVYLVTLIVHVTRNYNDRVLIYNSFVYWLLIALLGIGAFGNPIR